MLAPAATIFDQDETKSLASLAERMHGLQTIELPNQEE
jgi:hypothetical protein